MRKPIFLSLLGGIALAYSFATSPAEAETVKVNHGHFILVLNPQTADGKALTNKPAKPFWVIGSAARNAAGGFIFGGKKAPHLTGTIAGTSNGSTFKAKDGKGLSLDGQLGTNEKVTVLSGKFSLVVAKGTLGGTFALVPISTEGGKLMGGGNSLLGKQAMPNGWGSRGPQGVGSGMGDHFGYQGPGLFGADERPNLSGTSVSGATSSGWDDVKGAVKDVLQTAWDYWTAPAPGPTRGADGTTSTGNAAADARTAVQTAQAGQYVHEAADKETADVMNQSQDERETYGGTTLNPNNVLKGQDGGGNGLEWPAGSGSADLKPLVGKGDNPFELSSADQINLSKLQNGAIDPSPGTR